MLKQEDLTGFIIRKHLIYKDSIGSEHSDPYPTIDYIYESPFDIIHLSWDIEKEYFSHLDIWKKTQPENYVIKRIHFSCIITMQSFKDALALCDIDSKDFTRK